MVFDMFHRSVRSSGEGSIPTRPAHHALAAIEPTFVEPCFEGMENRVLLDVTFAEYYQIWALHPDLGLSANMADYNIIEITANQLSDTALRGAIATAGTTAANDLIVVRTTATQNTIALTGGQLTINADAATYGTVTIVSLGDAPLTIDAQQNSRVLYIDSNANVSLGRLTITNGYGNSGGGILIFTNGTLTVTDSTIAGNTTESYGGGIYNGGTLTVTRSTITGNTAFEGGGISSGGAVTTVTDSIIAENTAGRGGGIANQGMLTVTHSVITENAAGAHTDGPPDPNVNVIVGGGGIYNYGYGSTTVTDSVIAGNTLTLIGYVAYVAHGGGIYNDSTMAVTNSIITGNTSFSSSSFGYASGGGGIHNAGDGMLTVTNTTIAGNTASGDGGGISNWGSATVVDSAITRNTANEGGGIHNCPLYSGSGLMTVTNSIIAENTANEGGGIYSGSSYYGRYSTTTVTDSTITGNTAHNHGGGIYNGEDSPLTITNTEIAWNTAVAGDGGGVWNRGTLTVTDSTFAENTAAGDGGGIYNEHDYIDDDDWWEEPWSNLTITNSVITANTAGGSGGGICNGEGFGSLTVTSSTITWNTAGESGGGIFSAGWGGLLTVTNSTIAANTAYGYGGGGIYNGGFSSLTVTGSTIAGNTTYGVGGGMYGWNWNTLTVTDSTVTGNTAYDNGGGIYTTGMLTVTNSTIAENTAGWNGGGIWVSMIGLTMTGSTIAANTAGENGGGIWNGGELAMTDSVVAGNTAFGDGGGIYNAYGTSTVVNSVIAENTANEGGGIYSVSYYGIYGIYGTTTVVFSTITGNTASGGSGGGINSDGPLTVTNSVIADNTAIGGGGIHNDSGLLTVTGSTIRGNIASGGDGGGIWSDGTTTVTDSIIAGNTARWGGGIVDIGTLTVTNSTITGNTASDHGGGIVTRDTMILTNSTITGNTAHQAGGIYNEYGTSTVVNSLIAGNTAIWTGGGIRNYGSTLMVINSTIAGNTAGTGGGGVFNAYYSTSTLENTIVVGNNSPEDIYRETGTINGYNNLTTFTGWNGGSAGNLSYNSGLPLFVNAASGDYRLAAGSQAIDKGDNARAAAAGLTASSVDLAGNPRLFNGTIDIGAYEFESQQLARPTGIEAAAKNAATVTVKWNAVPNASGYVIQYATDKDFTQNVKTQPVSGGSANSADVMGLTPNTTYYFRVMATGTGNYTSSTYSGWYSVKTPAGPIPLDRPTGIEAAAKNAATVTVKWNAVPNASSYVIQYATDSGFTQNVKTQAVAGGTSSSADVTGLSANTTYYFKVMAVGTGSYVSSTYSGWYSAKTPVATSTTLDRPTGIEATPKNATTVTVKWNAVPNASSYVIQYATDKDFTQNVKTQAVAGGAASSADVAGLSANTTYYFRVMAVGTGSYVSSAYSGWYSATTPAGPSITLDRPTGIEATPKNATTVTVKWNAVTNASSYVIQYATDSAFTQNVKTQAVAGGTSSSADVTGLSANTTYYFRVMAVGTGSYVSSTYSGWYSAKTPVGPSITLDRPTGISASAKNSTTVTVKWNAVPNASGYVIQYATDSGFTQNVKTQSVSGNFADVTGLAANTTYYFRVLAVGTGSYVSSTYSGWYAAKTLL